MLRTSKLPHKLVDCRIEKRLRCAVLRVVVIVEKPPGLDVVCMVRRVYSNAPLVKNCSFSSRSSCAVAAAMRGIPEEARCPNWKGGVYNPCSTNATKDAGVKVNDQVRR